MALGELEHELASLDRPTGLRVRSDWMPYADSFLPDELSTEAANELLTIVSDSPVSPALNAWLGSVRGTLVECEAQVPLGSEL